MKTVSGVDEYGNKFIEIPNPDSLDCSGPTKIFKFKDDDPFGTEMQIQPDDETGHGNLDMQEVRELHKWLGEILSESEES